LEFAPTFQSNKRIVLQAVQRDWSALEHASEEAKQDKDILLAACCQNGEALLLASPELRNDKEV
jgi:hypothetical protein